MPLAADSDTVKSRCACPLSPSATLGLSIPTVGAASSSVIVPTPVEAEPSVALPGALSVSRTVSSGSSVVSPFTRTVAVLLVSPTANVSVVSVTAA